MWPWGGNLKGAAAGVAVIRPSNTQDHSLQALTASPGPTTTITNN